MTINDNPPSFSQIVIVKIGLDPLPPILYKKEENYSADLSKVVLLEIRYIGVLCGSQEFVTIFLSIHIFM